nr:immunoglobulin heavy chain junction region [Mus musculus]
CTGYYFAYW